MHKPVKHLAVAAASIVVAVGSPAAQTIDMVVDGAIYAIELNASAAAENFAKRLPMKVVWEDFGKLERIARLSERLDVGRDPVVKSPVRGDSASGGHPKRRARSGAPRPLSQAAPKIRVRGRC